MSQAFAIVDSLDQTGQKRGAGLSLRKRFLFISKSPSDVFLLCARHIYVHYSCTAAKYILNMYIRKMIDYKGLLVPVCNDVSKGQISCKNGNIPEYYCWNVMCVCVCVCVCVSHWTDLAV